MNYQIQRVSNPIKPRIPLQNPQPRLPGEETIPNPSDSTIPTDANQPQLRDLPPRQVLRHDHPQVLALPSTPRHPVNRPMRSMSFNTGYTHQLPRSTRHGINSELSKENINFDLDPQSRPRADQHGRASTSSTIRHPPPPTINHHPVYHNPLVAIPEDDDRRSDDHPPALVRPPSSVSRQGIPNRNQNPSITSSSNRFPANRHQPGSLPRIPRRTDQTRSGFIQPMPIPTPSRLRPGARTDQPSVSKSDPQPIDRTKIPRPGRSSNRPTESNGPTGFVYHDEDRSSRNVSMAIEHDSRTRAARPFSSSHVALPDLPHHPKRPPEGSIPTDTPARKRVADHYQHPPSAMATPRSDFAHRFKVARADHRPFQA